MINTFSELIDLFEKSENLEKSPKLFRDDNYNLENIAKFLEFLGHPEKNIKIIHIAGSKGKGTISCILSALIEKIGKKCGLFLSPHVYDYRERFKNGSSFFCNRSYINAAREFERYINQWESKGNKLTTFEKYFAYALILFKMEGCEYAVLETGLGGRKDATNAVYSFVEILSTIELEHTKILGNTIKKIAIEKSKIIKPNSIVFALNNSNEVDEIFSLEAKRQNAKIYFLNDLITELDFKINGDMQENSFVDDDGFKYKYKTSLFGKAFALDSALSIMCLKKLNLLTKNYTRIIEQISLPARFEKIYCNSIPIILDGAHTEKSIMLTLETFLKLYGDGNTLIFGCAKDKNIKAISDILYSHFSTIIVQKPGNFKESSIDEIYNEFDNKKSPNAVICKFDNPRESLETALKANKPVLITGSFYLCDEMNKAIKQKN